MDGRFLGKAEAGGGDPRRVRTALPRMMKTLVQEVNYVVVLAAACLSFFSLLSCSCS